MNGADPGPVSPRGSLMTTATFMVSAIPPSELERIRARGADDLDNPLIPGVVQDGEKPPLRCCLREALPGERVVLISYRPPHPGGPYAEVGPVFVHADRCEGFSPHSGYPAGFRHRRQLFRAYGRGGEQVHNQIVEPADVDAVLAQLLSRPEVEIVHSRNVLAGCYMFAINRASSVEVSDPVEVGNPVS
jgi:hypothetical protein